MVVGVGGYMTDPVVLKTLGTNLNVALRIHGSPEPPLFHPKLYLFQHQHFHRTLIGSMNFTNAGTTKNIESMFSTNNTNGAAGTEFDRYWNSPQAMPFDQFDLKSYEDKRRAMLAAVKAAGAAEVLEEDVDASAESQVEIDILKEGWKAYVQQLIASHHLEGHRRVTVRPQSNSRSSGYLARRQRTSLAFCRSLILERGAILASGASTSSDVLQGQVSGAIRLPCATTS
jgi:IS1 family transposase